MNWLASISADAWGSVVLVLVAGAVGLVIGWSLGFDKAWDRRTADPVAAIDRAPDLHDLTTVESEAFARGVEAGIAREHARQRAVRSKAGIAAAETAKLRRNRVTGEVRPDLPESSGTVASLDGVWARNGDAPTITGDGPE